MRKLMLVLAVLAFTAVSGAAIAAEGWETDFVKASAEAQRTGKYMLLDFSGSDWCGWCVKLDQEIFSKNEFKQYAGDNLVCVMLDFPRAKPQSDALKKQNAELAKKYGIRGYPTVIVLGPDGELVGKTGYKSGGPNDYVKHIEEMIAAHKAKK